MIKKAIEQFYTGLNDKNADAMTVLYADDVQFEDPAFGPLQGEHAKNMWRMLCQNAKDMTVEVKDIIVSDEIATATWIADYTFSQTGRRVHNVIYAKFLFEDGKIVKHIDNFNLYKWAQQAMGLSGYLIGWSRFFQRRLWSKTHGLLYKFENQ